MPVLAFGSKLRTKSVGSAACSPGERLPEKAILPTKTTLQRRDWRFAMAYLELPDNCKTMSRGNGLARKNLLIVCFRDLYRVACWCLTLFGWFCNCLFGSFAGVAAQK